MHELSDAANLRGLERGVDVLLTWSPDGAHVIGGNVEAG